MHLTAHRSAATSASRSISACAPAARVIGTCFRATCLSGTRATARSAPRDAAGLAARAEHALAKLYPSYPAQKAELLEREPARPFARRVDLLRLAESLANATIVFVSHPWGGGIRRYMNDLAALADERCDVLYLEPAVGRHGEALVSRAPARA